MLVRFSPYGGARPAKQTVFKVSSSKSSFRGCHSLLASQPGLVKGSIRDQVLRPALRQLLASLHARLFKSFLDRDQLVALVRWPPERDFCGLVLITHEKLEDPRHTSRPRPFIMFTVRIFVNDEIIVGFIGIFLLKQFAQLTAASCGSLFD
jgi:hypothetical protein